MKAYICIELRWKVSKGPDKCLKFKEDVCEIADSYMKEDHRSYRHSFYSCEKKAWIFFQTFFSQLQKIHL